MPLKSIKNLFIQTEFTGEEEPAETSKEAAKAEPTPAPKSSTQVSSKPATTKEVGRFVEILTKDIEKSNLDGYDYLEFKTSIEELKESGLTQDQAIKSASIAVKSLTSPKNIIDSISHYKQVVDKNKKEFEQNVVIKLKEKIQEDQKELANTVSEIERLKGLEQKLRKSIEENEQKAETNSHGFEEAYKIVIATLKEDELSIKKVLGDK
ncbi:hypothetical protein [Leptospira sp. GIMC2001]|uniref:hypothetical protein n=1 Tax=Leptospira sp. GIMC2001 TaxID=1513297 RepID=UPI0023490846|nr:hypothetical protein [Leptospira sp. GIMC2001]WCL49791.1 hypothetical protein O4O04_02935 [Leptospira sp. GIMC2001]